MSQNEKFVKPSYRTTQFKEALRSTNMLVKSVHTGEVKSIERPSIEVRTDLRVDNFLVQKDRIRPKV